MTYAPLSKIITQPAVRVLILPPPSQCRVKKNQQDNAEIHGGDIFLLVSHVQHGSLGHDAQWVSCHFSWEDDPTILFNLFYGVHSMNTFFFHPFSPFSDKT